MALRLQRYGITRVRPLQGGLNLWKQRQYPVETIEANNDARAPAAAPQRASVGVDGAIVTPEAPERSRPGAPH